MPPQGGFFVFDAYTGASRNALGSTKQSLIAWTRSGLERKRKMAESP